MKLVTVKVMGSSAEAHEDFTGSTLADLKSFINLEGPHTAVMNGATITDATEIGNGAFVVFTPSVKGA